MNKLVLAVLLGAALGVGSMVAVDQFTEGAVAQQPVPTPQQKTRDHKDKAWIGVQWVTDANGSLEITQVQPGSPAWNAGLIGGDKIVGIEILVKGKPVEKFIEGQMVPYFQIGLATAAPGTEFKVMVRRGQVSMNAEKLLAVDAVREGIEIPAAQGWVNHIREKAKSWRQAELVWMTIKSGSYNEFSSFALKQQRLEVARLEAMKLQQEIKNAETKQQLLIEQIRTAIAERNLALAQKKTAELQRTQSGLGIVKAVFGLMSFFF